MPETALDPFLNAHGSDTPRIAPPIPARHLLADFDATAKAIGINLYPWQRVAARYITALGAERRWLYRHVVVIVARQNGKTTLLVPLICQRLLAGHKIMHTAQDRNLPREVFAQIADHMGTHHVDQLLRRGGRIVMPRFANGQEEVRMRNGGIYSIVAPTRSGARGPARDLVIIDELREMDSNDFIAAAGPTLQASASPQMLYLSNAGSEHSLVLNSLRAARDTDPSLAYLEWSAEETLAADDVTGWCQANPSIGYNPSTIANVAADHDSYKARGAMSVFETENLCRWVVTSREMLVDEFDWMSCKGPVGTPTRPALAVSLDPDGRRVSIAMAWREEDVIALRLVAHESGDPVDTDTMGETLREFSNRHGASVGFDPLTDAQLVKHVRKGRTTPIAGQKYAAASAQFALAVAGQRIRWADADAVTGDLTWTSRKPDGTDGSFHAVRAQDDHPITASLAAIRAVWLASQPKASGRLVVR